LAIQAVPSFFINIHPIENAEDGVLYISRPTKVDALLCTFIEPLRIREKTWCYAQRGR